MNFRNIIISQIIFLGVLFGVPALAHADVSIHIEPSKSTMSIDDAVTVLVYVDTDDESINAIEGTISYSGPIESEIIYTGKSFIALWMDPADFFKKDSDGVQSLYFSGIKPHGIISDIAKVFSVKFRSTGIGVGYVTLSDVRIVTNELYEKVYTFQTIKKSIYVKEGEKVVKETGPNEFVDINPPLPFRPIIVTGSGYNNGGFNAVFVTQDLESGMSHYRIYETSEPISPETIESTKDNWILAESPFKLSYHAPENFIYIVAYDKVGNSRLSVIEPSIFMTPPVEDLSIYYELMFVLLIILLLILLFLLFLLIKRRKEEEEEEEKKENQNI